MTDEMGATHSIVAGTDGSERAEQAVARAGELARALGTSVHLVTAYKRVTDSAWVAAGGGMGVAAITDDDELARGEAEEIVARSSRELEGQGLTVHGHVCAGDPAQALMSVAENESAGMIVVGNRGMHGAHRLLGSVPDRVAHHAKCEVLIVPTA
ncbi:MAG TPA: universal stress protein [Solirubrobacteraceae bacterium]|jgi:nucleotide-binding universal stress UspA family protein|nr:universal stress protein [Solirubrobacteraceae bacterium]